MRNLRPWAFLASVFALFMVSQAPVFADGFPLTVSAAYADNIHCAQFNVNPGECVANPPATFPGPWQGSAGVSQFIGTGVEGVGFDGGALLLTNNGASSVAVSDVTVTIGTASFDLWGSFSVPSGTSVILTQTSFDPVTLNPNFDTSDLAGCCSNNGVIPTIAITIGGTTTTFLDSNQVLNTGGFDTGCQDTNCVLTNESEPWSVIPPPAETPEPPGVVLLGSGMLLVLFGAGVRRKLCCRRA